MFGRLAAHAALGLALAWLCGCEGAPRATHVGGDLRDTPTVTSSNAVTASTSAPASSGTAAPAPAPHGATDVAKRSSPFPPAAITPLIERTAKPGDGAWTLLPAAGVEPSPLATTVVHPHKIKPFVVVALVAVDVSRASLGLVAGTEEPKNDAISLEARSGLVPKGDLAGLLVAMNGGFKRRHGEHGMKLGAVEYVPPKDDSCTVAALASGEVRIGTWSTMSGDASSFAFSRQGPPCLVESGSKNADTTNEVGAKKWGSSETGEREIRRSALAISKDGETLYYAVGDWVDASMLADALVAAHVDAAVELDINWSFTRFVLYGRDAQGNPVAGSPLLEKLKFSASEYWKAPSARDFFYLRKR